MIFSDKKITISLGGESIFVPIADDFISRAFGLMFRDPRKSTRMLFVLDSITKPIVWNFGMRFPISIVWFNKGKIIGTSRLPRFSVIPKIAISPSACDSFLEIKEGILSAEELARVRIINE